MSPSTRGSPLPSSASIVKKMADRAGIVRHRATISAKDSSLVQMNCSRSLKRPNSRFISFNQNCSTWEAPTTTMTVRVSGRSRKISSIISAGSCCVATVVSFSANVRCSTKRRSTPAMSIGVAGKRSSRNCWAKVAAGPPIVRTRSSLSAPNADRMRCAIEPSGGSPLARAACTDTSTKWMGSRDDGSDPA